MGELLPNEGERKVSRFKRTLASILAGVALFIPARANSLDNIVDIPISNLNGGNAMQQYIDAVPPGVPTTFNLVKDAGYSTANLGNFNVVDRNIQITTKDYFHTIFGNVSISDTESTTPASLRVSNLGTTTIYGFSVLDGNSHLNSLYLNDLPFIQVFGTNVGVNFTSSGTLSINNLDRFQGQINKSIKISPTDTMKNVTISESLFGFKNALDVSGAYDFFNVANNTFVGSQTAINLDNVRASEGYIINNSFTGYENDILGNVGSMTITHNNVFDGMLSMMSTDMRTDGLEYHFDPMYKNPTKWDFTLREESPLWFKGFFDPKLTPYMLDAQHTWVGGFGDDMPNIPEPSTAALLASGMVTLYLLARRRHDAK